jgi:hypothetical protein
VEGGGVAEGRGWWRRVRASAWLEVPSGPSQVPEMDIPGVLCPPAAQGWRCGTRERACLFGAHGAYASHFIARWLRVCARFMCPLGLELIRPPAV